MKRENPESSYETQANFAFELLKSEVADRLREAVRRAGGNQAVAARAGVPVGTLNNYLRLVSEPKAITLGLIARACGVGVDFLLTGHAPGAETPVMENAVSVGMAEWRPGVGLEDMGTALPFPAAVLSEIGLGPAQARLLLAAGDGMRPTIGDGDLMLVDVSEAARGHVLEGRIHVFAARGDLFVRRLRREPGGLVMSSDDPARFPDRLLPGEGAITLYGRVRWAGREL